MRELRRDEHGGLSELEATKVRHEHGEDLEFVDLSVNINPSGPPPNVLSAIRAADLSKYPDPEMRELRSAWAQSLAISPNRVVFGSGACELLWTLARVLSSPTAPVLIVEPTFSEYARAALACGARVNGVWGAASSDFRVSSASILSEARRTGAKSVYLCRPNNPTGTLMPFDEVTWLASTLGEVQLVLDESFLSLSEAATDRKRQLPQNVIRVRSLTKDFALPGLRLGYLIASPSLAEQVETARAPWTISSCAEAGAFAILNEEKSLEQSSAAFLRNRLELERGLSSFGLQFVPSATVFTLVEVGEAVSFRSSLLESGVVVRDASSFGLSSHVRIAAGTEPMRTRLWMAVEAIAR